VWPAEGQGDGGPASAELVERVQGYLMKAAREAKQYTTWTTVRDEYEGAVRAFTDALLTSDAGAEFRRELSTLARRVAAAGAWSSLARTLLHLAAPGTPDVYQGDELWLLALVDPDNRRPVDWAARAALVTEAERADDAGDDGEARWWDAALAGAPASPGAVKLRLLRRLLLARRRDPALFVEGAYVALTATGARSAHVAAFARTHGDGAGDARGGRGRPAPRPRARPRRRAARRGALGRHAPRAAARARRDALDGRGDRPDRRAEPRRRAAPRRRPLRGAGGAADVGRDALRPGGVQGRRPPGRDSWEHPRPPGCHPSCVAEGRSRPIASRAAGGTHATEEPARAVVD
jgi:hypothetical protein